MAISASKSVDLNSGSGYKYGLTAYFVENSTSVANNTSNITVRATLASKGASWSSSYNSPLRIYWHDNRENYDRLVATTNIKSLGANASATASGTINVTHNNDGSLSGYAYATFTKNANTSWCPNSGSVATNNTALTTIPRASVPSINTWPNNTPDFNIGDTITIYMNRKSTSFTHTVYLDFGNSQYLVGTDVAENIQFDTATIANQMYQTIPNANVGEGQIRVITYNGSTEVGTATCLFYAHVTNANPSFTSAYQDTNSTVVAITGDNQNIVRNQSTLQITVSASAQKSASISSATCKLLNTTYNGTRSGNNFTFNIGVVNSASNVTATITVTDSRGNSTTTDKTITVLDWTLPSAIITASRHNNYYSNTDIKVNADWSSVDGKNTCTIQLRYKKTTDSSYSAYTTMQDNVTQTFTLDNGYAWDIQVLLTDKFGTTTYNLVVNRGMPIQFWDKNKSSVGFNCFPENDNAVEVENDLLVQGENILSRIAGYGQQAISAPTDDWNTAGGTKSGFYMGSNMSNAPGNSTDWFFVLHLVHNNKYMRQLAFDFFSINIWTRRMDNGSWGSWEQVH